MTSPNNESGAMLSVATIDDLACRIASMWTSYNQDRTNALKMNEEARQYVFATDVDSTTAQQLPHKNRTHQPKLTQISDNLQSQYWEASLGTPQFFKYDGQAERDRQRAGKMEAWVRTKLEAKKFRSTVGRQLLADYVNYGNCFASIDYVVEQDDNGKIIYQGPLIERISPLDQVFNPRAESFRKSPKLTRKLIHIAEIAELPSRFPTGGFLEGKIREVLATRNPTVVTDWIQVLKDRGLSMDGFGTYNDYFRQDLVELLIYRGDVFNPETGETQRNRIVYVVDRCHVIRNEASISPRGFDGIHHAGWRVRNDNLWAQGPLDNIVGMQYRIDHLENLRADVFDLIAHPVLLCRGENVQEPSGGYRPGATYHCGAEEEVKIMVPDSTALRADTQIAQYHRLMEEFAGAPPETQGIRTPGEKTAFEVNKLDANATKMFVDKARNFELMLETMLLECLHLMVKNFSSVDYMEIFDDMTGEKELKELSQADMFISGQFVATGSAHWSRRNREATEMQQFQMGPLQDPKIRAHLSGIKLAEFYEKRMGIEDEGIIEEFAGVKEDVEVAMVAEAEKQRLSSSLEAPLPTEQNGEQVPLQPRPLQPSAGANKQNPVPASF